jgi:hypothetical protein
MEGRGGGGEASGRKLEGDGWEGRGGEASGRVGIPNKGACTHSASARGARHHVVAEDTSHMLSRRRAESEGRDGVELARGLLAEHPLVLVRARAGRLGRVVQLSRRPPEALLGSEPKLVPRQPRLAHVRGGWAGRGAPKRGGRVARRDEDLQRAAIDERPALVRERA